MFLKVLDRGLATEYYQLTDDIADMVKDLEEVTPQAEYFFIKSTPGTVVIHRATLSTGPRPIVREFEKVEVEAAGEVVGSTEILK